MRKRKYTTEQKRDLAAMRNTLMLMGWEAMHMRMRNDGELYHGIAFRYQPQGQCRVVVTRKDGTDLWDGYMPQTGARFTDKWPSLKQMEILHAHIQLTSPAVPPASSGAFTQVHV